MSLLSAHEWRVAEAIAGIGYVNPFLPERMDLEKKALGDEYVHFQPFLQYRPDCSMRDTFPNASKLRQRSEQLLVKILTKLSAHEPASDRELEVYENLVLYQLYARHMSRVLDLPVTSFCVRPDDDILDCYSSFVKDFQQFLVLPERKLPSNLDRDIIFAGLFQIIAATNRDLAAEMEAGRFREDFYYRLCADRIETPSLRAQLVESPDGIINFVRFIATRMLPYTPAEAGRLTDEVVTWIAENLGPDYAWSGNIRELEQCVRSIMIRGSYIPARSQASHKRSQVAEFLAAVEKGELDRDQLLNGYFSLVHAKTGSYRATGRQLGVDWRTVKEIVDIDLVRKFAEDETN